MLSMQKLVVISMPKLKSHIVVPTTVVTVIIDAILITCTKMTLILVILTKREII